MALQAKLDSVNREHGDSYVEGIQPRFDPLKARHFDLFWNWVRQDALLMYYDIISGRLTTVDCDITARCISLLNRIDPDMLQYHIYKRNPSEEETYKLAKEFGQQLTDNTREVIGKPPLCKDGEFHIFIFFGLNIDVLSVTFRTAPHTEVTKKGEIVYSEVVRENVRKLEAYIKEIASSDGAAGPISINIQKVQDDILTGLLSSLSLRLARTRRIVSRPCMRMSLHKGPDPCARGQPRNCRSSSLFFSILLSPARSELRSSRDFSPVVLTSLLLLPVTTARLSNTINLSFNLLVVVDRRSLHSSL